MSTADYAKAAYGSPSGSHEEMLTRLVNEIFRSPPAGVGVGLNLAGPGLGGFGASPGAVTTALPKPLVEPQATHAAAPSTESALTQLVLPVSPAPSHAGPSAGGAGVTPGAVTSLDPKLEPSAAQTASAAAAPQADPLDQLAAAALAGPAYTGPSLSGVGISPGIATSIPGVEPSQSAAKTDAPISAPALPGVAPLGLGIPGEAYLQSLFSPAIASPSAAARPSTYAGSPSSFYFLDEARTAPHGVQVPPTAAGTSTATPEFQSAHPGFDVNQVRRDFPILKETVNGRPLIWLDNAATTQKPQSVIDRIAYFYEHENSNIHRAAHELAARSTDAYEAAREKVRRFLNAGSADEIVFVRGATEAINLVAKTWGKQYIGKGDEIVITHLEHHANIVPWQQLAAETGALLRVAPVDDNGEVLLDEYAKLLTSRVKLVSFTQVANAIGTVTPAKTMVEMAHRVGAKALVDGAQAVSHMRADVQALDADWYVFSGHKVFAPTGIGVLYGKLDILNASPPWQGGGNMIQDVTFERTIFHNAPGRFEAGTGNIADAVGLGAAIDYVERIGIDTISRYEHGLIVYATRLLREVPGLKIVGNAAEKAGVISFVLGGMPSEQVGSALNREGIAVRSGHHCAQPILRRLGYEATVRPSFAFYNTCAEIDALVAALYRFQGDNGVARS
jgi:cysteine desulfurase/selenocysteine lyase